MYDKKLAPHQLILCVWTKCVVTKCVWTKCVWTKCVLTKCVLIKCVDKVCVDKVCVDKVCVDKVCVDKVCYKVSVDKVCVDKVLEGGEEEEAEEAEPGIQNQKQEPHTKMWGKSFSGLISEIYSRCAIFVHLIAQLCCACLHTKGGKRVAYGGGLQDEIQRGFKEASKGASKSWV